jgi:hypothetical protein
MRTRKFADEFIHFVDKTGGITVRGNPGGRLKDYAETHWRLSEIAMLYGVPKHKLAFLLPPSDLVVSRFRKTRLWSRQRVIEVLGVPV